MRNLEDTDHAIERTVATITAQRPEKLNALRNRFL
jgi:hypothetical protein